jgi:tetratricopeptide (TPR) repeat protein
MIARIAAAAAVLFLGSSLAVAQTPAASPARAELDEVRRLASVLDYAGAMKLFESVRKTTPDAIESLDVLKIQIVYLETGHTEKFLDLARWLIARYKAPKVSTDAERSVKGYLIWKGATDRTMLNHALEMTRFARERAVASGEGEYQGFFDTAYGIALYRLGRYADAAKWLPAQLDHQDVLVRTLSLGFSALNEFKLGNRDRSHELMARARKEQVNLPKLGSPTIGADWTDVLITQMVMAEAETLIRP